MLLFWLGLGMPTLCQVCSKPSELGEAVVSASVLGALFYSGTQHICGEPEDRCLGIHNGPVLQRRWMYERAMTSEPRGQSCPGSLSSQSITVSGPHRAPCN